MSDIRVEGELVLASAPAALWPLISNTDRLNKAAGLPENAVEKIPGSFDRMVGARLLGLPVRWREHPFDYVAERGYRVVRDFESGPVARFDGTLELRPEGTGSRVRYTAMVTPRWPPARLPVALFARKTLKDLLGQIKSADESLTRVGELPPLPRTVSPHDESAFAARSRLFAASGADPAAAARLTEHLRSGPDDEVANFRPFELADRWKLPRLAVLCACLHAVKAGLLDMRWDVLCPNCLGAPESHASLSGLLPSSHCAGCGIQYGVGFDESVELRFSVHPAVRSASAAVYCAGSPAHTRHTVAQRLLSPGRPSEIELDVGAKSYSVHGMGSLKRVRLRPREDAPNHLEIDLGRAKDGDELAFRPGTVRLKLASPAEELARVEAESWREAGATAALVTSLQEFRSLFSSEVLAPGQEIGVRRLALLFTDLKASTALYERIGDAPAYGVVREHFDYLTAIIAARRGALVKTIGDAVMAVFLSPTDALEAALDMQERIGELDTKLAPREPVVLKIGVHEGPAIAINASGALDYFGTTANVAARVQGESAGGDIVITDVLRGDPAVQDALARRAPEQAPFDSALKGLTGVHRLWRLTPRGH